MWFKRKPTNRRLRRGSVLEVKLRSSKLRAARFRLAAASLGTIFGVVMGGYLLWCGSQWALNWLIYRNQEFAIARIDLQTDGVISPDQLRRWAGVKVGDNLFALDLQAVRRRLKLIPMVESVSLDRLPPRTLRIRVAEREPIARVLAERLLRSGQITPYPFLLDAEGYVMLPLNPRDRSTPAKQSEEILPVLYGINPNEVQPGRRIESPQVRAALQLLVAFDRSPMAGLVELKQIDVSAPDVLVAKTDEGSQVTFGLTGLPQQLARWREIYDAGRRSGKTVATLDLAVTDSIPCCWLEANAQTPAVSRSPKPPIHTRRKHV